MGTVNMARLYPWDMYPFNFCTTHSVHLDLLTHLRDPHERRPVPGAQPLPFEHLVRVRRAQFMDRQPERDGLLAQPLLHREQACLYLRYRQRHSAEASDHRLRRDTLRLQQKLLHVVRCDRVPHRRRVVRDRQHRALRQLLDSLGLQSLHPAQGQRCPGRLACFVCGMNPESQFLIECYA
ncbi:hypothetical protein DM02DRAFT_412631 [Periconia macrospinosa]|uniref:Uncharacterized protein n=1 Tax=Periconia macrospinosa TaxID=97972 RepID=A0A2V1CZI4_9PLEO|nr:hypothetical protein DM02DRAFT_412631 [Periconia macrospinosa]